VRTPSPNYFGLIVEPAEGGDSGVLPKDNWSPPTSSIRSFAAPSPKHIPLDSNPDFAAFKRQTESNQGFNLGHGSLSHFASTPGLTLDPKATSRRSARTEASPISPKSKGIMDPLMERMDMDYPGRVNSAHVSADSKRASDASMDAPSFFDMPRQASPAAMPPPRQAPTLSGPRTLLSRLDDRHPRLSLPSNKAAPPSPQQKPKPSSHVRAETLPAALEGGPVMAPPSQLKEMMETLDPADFLLLDLRVFPQYSSSRIKDALNLCIPTTLLKRPSFNLKKLSDTFNSDEEKKKRFDRWKSCKYIIVYDAYSSDKKDAISAVNTLKKFSNEGWNGHSLILRGGFAAFSKEYPHLVDQRTSLEIQSGQKKSTADSAPDVAPVAGGCLMPATDKPANPFFSNIRQNMDLVGGVGRMDIKRPSEFDQKNEEYLPKWLRQASAQSNHGELVSDKFYHIEVAEQNRMQQALSGHVQYGSPGPDAAKRVQIAGFEKGVKNRYNNIWPFEHTRVKLQGKEDCDYVNANHIKAKWSNKRYIASQGPLPATYEVSIGPSCE
jgi:hypothetical protein